MHPTSWPIADQIAALETATGTMRKSAGTDARSLDARMDAMEIRYLGIAYDGPMQQRIRQLAKAVEDAWDNVPADLSNLSFGTAIEAMWLNTQM